MKLAFVLFVIIGVKGIAEESQSPKLLEKSETVMDGLYKYTMTNGDYCYEMVRTYDKGAGAISTTNSLFCFKKDPNATQVEKINDQSVGKNNQPEKRNTKPIR